MSDNLRKQIYNNLISKDTDDLLEIWQNADANKWQQEVFEIVKEILLERLGYVPPQTIETQVRKILYKVKEHLNNNELNKALSECEIAIQLDPNSAIAHYYRGEIYDELGQRENAITNYQEAIRLDPELDDAREIMLCIETEIKEEIENQVWQILDKVEEHLKNNELDKALSECELAIQLNPAFAITYNYRGEIYDEMGYLAKAIVDYQEALRFDPELEEAWGNLRSAEKDLEVEFQQSSAKEHLDLALEYAYSDEPGMALEECELARQTMPGIAIAYNYLGMLLEELDQLESAIDTYREAIQLNPRFYAARENLANARVKLEYEQYRQVAMGNWNVTQEELETIPEFYKSQDMEMSENNNPVPEWLYMGEKAYWLSGWPGHRIRQERSGFDPLDSDFELAHMEGVIIHSLLTGKFRTYNPIYLILLAFISFVFCLPLFFGGITFFQNAGYSIFVLIIFSPYWIFGALLLASVYWSWSIMKNSNGYEEDGNTFSM